MTTVGHNQKPKYIPNGIFRRRQQKKIYLKNQWVKAFQFLGEIWTARVMKPKNPKQDKPQRRLSQDTLQSNCQKIKDREF